VTRPDAYAVAAAMNARPLDEDTDGGVWLASDAAPGEQCDACAVLASAWWAYWDRCGYTAKGIREQARKTFGRGIASRWFS